MDDDFDLDTRLQNNIPNAFARLLQTRCPGRALLHPREASQRGGALGDMGYFEHGGFTKEFNVYDPSDRYVPLPRRADRWLVDQDYTAVMPLTSSRFSEMEFQFNASVAVPPLQEAPLHVQPKITLKDDEYASLYAYAPVMRDWMLREEIKDVKNWLVRHRHIAEPNTCVLTSRVRASGWISVYQAAHKQSMSFLGGFRSPLGGAQGNISRTVDEDKSAMTRGPHGWTAAAAEANYTVIAGYSRALSRLHYKRLLTGSKITAADSAMGESHNPPQVMPGALPPGAGVQSTVLTPTSPTAQPPAAEAPSASLALHADEEEEVEEEEEEEEREGEDEEEDSGDILMSFLEAVLERLEDIDVVVGDTGLILDFVEAYNVAPTKSAVAIVVEIREEKSAIGSKVEMAAFIDELLPASEPTVVERLVDTKVLHSSEAPDIRRQVPNKRTKNRRYGKRLSARFIRRVQFPRLQIRTHHWYLKAKTSTLAVQASTLPSPPSMPAVEDSELPSPPSTLVAQDSNLPSIPSTVVPCGSNTPCPTSATAAPSSDLSRTLGVDDYVPEELKGPVMVAVARYESSRGLKDLDELLQLWRLVLARCDSERGTFSALQRIAMCLIKRQQLIQDAADLDELIDTLSRLIEHSLDSESTLSLYVGLRAQALLKRYQRRSNLDDLDLSVAAFRQACELSPDARLYVNGLVNALRFRVRDVEQRSDIDELTILASRPVEYEEPSDRDNFIALQEYYSFRRFRGLGKAEDIDSSVARPQMAGNDMASLAILGHVLERRFLRYGELSDLDLAIRLISSVVERRPSTLRDVPVLQRLAASYAQRFLQTDRSSDINEAITVLLRAIELDRRKAHRYTHLHLAYCYMLRFYRGTGEEADIDHAIEVLRNLRDTYDGVGTAPEWYLTYGECLMARCSRLNDPAAMHEMISVFEEGANHIRGHTMARADILRDLALARIIALSYDMRGLSFSLVWSRAKAALMALVDAARAASDRSQELFLARHFSTLYAACHRFVHTPEEAQAFVDVDVVKDMHSRLLDWTSEEIWLGDTSSRSYEALLRMQLDASAAVATALLIGDKDAALVWFEQGRAIVWSQIQDLPLEELRQQYPDLADKLGWLAAALEDAHWTAPPLLRPNDILPLGLEEHTVAKRSIAREHKLLLEEIRSLDGFQSFLRPKSASALLTAAGDRAVACINVHDSRCDALIIFRSEMHHVSLPQLTPAKVGEWHVRLERYLQWERARAIDDPRGSEAAHHHQHWDSIRDVLREMWDCVVLPILEAYLDKLEHVHGRAHITWCTTGQLAFLPLHAAGPYDGESLNAFDLVVSSYTPNLSSLLPSTTVIEATASPSILVVAQPNTPGTKRLPWTVEESKKVAANFPTDSAKVLLGQDGSIGAVLEHMAKHPYVHLACRGKQDVDPTRSAFLLNDGPLMLHTLMAHKLRNAQLAFLSACETATGDAMVPNEAVHLAAGMLAAGYKSVVATMWSIGDTEAPRVADEFYKALLADPDRNVAFALHTAVQKLREHVGVDNFVKWMPFIHLGL